MTIFLIISAGPFAELAERAPDVLPGTLPEMRDPSYWIARMEKPDEIILTSTEIQRMNEDFMNKMRAADPFKNVPAERKSPLQHYFPGIALVVPDIRNMKPEVRADSVRSWIKTEIKYLRSRDFGNTRGVRYAEREIDAIENEMALTQVKNTIYPREGIAVRTTHLKNVPAFFPEKVGLILNDAVHWDRWDFGILKIGKPVVILHPSASGEFVFVVCEVGWGWVRSEDVAFGNKRELDDFINAVDFVICTGDRVQFYSDESCTFASGWFRMGDRLPLVIKNKPRRVKVPVRRMNGSFGTETAWLQVDADVHVGLPPYTRRNIVNTAFKLLDNPYDFTGTFYGRQHETTYRDIFTCFGFDLPYHGGLFTHYGHDETVLHPEAGTEEQYRVILKHEPFITIQTTIHDRGGHSQLLLGEYRGVPIVFDQHGYGYKDENGRELIISRCCIGTVSMPTYFLKRKITFLTLK